MTHCLAHVGKRKPPADLLPPVKNGPPGGGEVIHPA